MYCEKIEDRSSMSSEVRKNNSLKVVLNDNFSISE